MKIKIINISDNNKHFKSAIEEYNKRLWKELEIIDIKPIKSKSIDETINLETEKIIKKIEKYNNFYKIILNKDWKKVSSFDIADFLENKRDIVFIIWWPYGLNYQNLLKYIDKEISFWNITLPHWLAKLTLLEQIYRWDSINKKKKYHY